MSAISAISANWIYFMKLTQKQLKSTQKLDILSIYRLFSYVETNDMENIIEMIGLQYPKIPISCDLNSTIFDQTGDVFKESIKYSGWKLLKIFGTNLKIFGTNLNKLHVTLNSDNDLQLDHIQLTTHKGIIDQSESNINIFKWILDTYDETYRNYLILFFNMIIKGHLIYARILTPTDISYIMSLFEIVKGEQFSFVGRPVHIKNAHGNDNVVSLIEMELNICTFYLQSVLDDEEYYKQKSIVGGKKDWNKSFLYQSYYWFGFMNTTEDEIVYKISSLGDHEYGKMAQQDNMFPAIENHVFGYTNIIESTIRYFNGEPQTQNSISLIESSIALSTNFNSYLFTKSDETEIPYLYVFRMEQVPVTSTGKLYKDIKQGEEIELYKPTSTSYAGPASAKFFGILLRFRISKNVAFICVDGINRMSENEIILPTGTKCICLHKWYDLNSKDKSREMTLYIDFEVVPNINF